MKWATENGLSKTFDELCQDEVRLSLKSYSCFNILDAISSKYQLLHTIVPLSWKIICLIVTFSISRHLEFFILDLSEMHAPV
jgi:hypothetical protein